MKSVLSSINYDTILPIIFTIAGLWIVFYYYKKIQRIKNEKIFFGGGSTDVPIISGYGKLKNNNSWFITITHNNLNPRLIFYPDHFITKVIIRKRHNYSDVELVSISTISKFKRLEFNFKNSHLGFACSLFNDNNLKLTIEFLKQKGCPISSSAENFLNQL